MPSPRAKVKRSASSYTSAPGTTAAAAATSDLRSMTLRSTLTMASDADAEGTVVNSRVPSIDHDKSSSEKAPLGHEDAAAVAPGLPTHELARDAGVSKHSTPGDVEKHGLGEVEREAESQQHLTGFKLWIVYFAMLLAIFLVALDQTILAPALPVIASVFNSLDNIGWISSAFFLTQAPLLLLYGQMLTVVRTKTVFLIAVTLFELGSLVCAVAKNVDVLIFGRAFAGVGAGGLFVSVLLLIVGIAPIEKRPLLMGGFGGVWGLASVIGPLLGGAFTDKVSWRWCFYINLPIGAITVGVIFFYLKAYPSPAEADPNDNRTMVKRLMGLDWVGAVLMLGIVSCLVLALSWGGISRPWSSASVITPLVVFGVFIPVLVAWEWYMGEKALLPLRLFRNRTMIGAILSGFFSFLSMLCLIYYLPLQYQAVKHASATRSGIDILPYMLAVVFGAIISGGLVQATGHYWPFMVFPPPLLTAVGAGLMWTVTTSTPNARIIGFQILMGFGIGCTMQQGLIAVQAEYHATPTDIPQATATLSFFQLIAGVIGLAICQSLLIGGLKTELAPYNLPADTILAITGSVEVIWHLPADLQKIVIEAYVTVLHHIYIVGVPTSILGAAAALLIRRHNIKKMGIEMGAAA